MKKKKRKKPNAKAVIETAAPKISVCLIAKNEEKSIDRCLNSIEEIADEIIFVDTGSTDQTADIAKKYTDKIYFHPWNDSFSEARNHYLDHATGDWIFQIDADEELVKEGIPVIRKAVQDPTIDAVMVEIASRMRNGRGESFHCVERIFRNNGRIHYEGRVHNRLVGITNAKIFPIRLIHYGYDLDAESSQKKFNRTVSLLKKDLEDDPNNPMTYHYLGCSYLFQGMFEQSYEASKKAIELSSARNDPNLIYLWSHYNAAASCYKLKNLAEAETISLSALKQYPNHVDSHFILSLVYFDRQQWGKLIFHGREYIRLSQLQQKSPQAFGNLVTSSLKEEWNIGALVGIAYAELGDRKKAEEMFQKAMDLAPEPFRVPRAAGIFFHKKGHLNEARSYLLKADTLNRGDQTVLQLLDEINKKIGDPGKEPTISCCMIVKNEEAFLEQCLKSVKDYVDEIVIVDTGSTDQTVDIARKYTDKVYFHPWEGSFSKARNQAMSYATKDWIFQIDGDEEMLEGGGQKLRQAVREAGDADIIYVNIISTYSAGRKTARHNFERLFKNNGVIHYEGIVHNRVVGGRSAKTSQIELMHYGYNVDEKKAHEKFLRTAGLLKKQIEEEPDNPMPHHYLGVSYLSRGMNREAADESEKAIELAVRKGDKHPLYIWARHNAAMAFFRLGNLDKAREYSLDALTINPDHLDSHYMLAMVAAEKSEWKDVLTYGERFLELQDIFEKNPEKAGLVINTTLNEGTSIHLLVGHAWHGLGETAKMEREYQSASGNSENPWEVWWNAGCFHLDRSGDLELAETYLQAALDRAPEQQEIWYMLAKLNNKRGKEEDEEKCLEKLWDMGTDDVVVLNRLATFRMKKGRQELAFEALQKSIQKEPHHYGTLSALGNFYEETNQTEKAIESYKQMIELYPTQSDPWLHLGKISLKLGQFEEARIFIERVLEQNPHEIPALMYLSEIELKQSRIIEFVESCDRLLEELHLNRRRVIDSLSDVLDVLQDIQAALKDRPPLESQAKNLVLLLESFL
jgi:glycosyltransferase involved in cell wall biosynthesis/Tfp pilus assembly protein PilF